jgi:hypothetical protein
MYLIPEYLSTQTFVIFLYIVTGKHNGIVTSFGGLRLFPERTQLICFDGVIILSLYVLATFDHSNGYFPVIRTPPVFSMFLFGYVSFDI